MKNIKLSVLALVLAGITFVSCKKEATVDAVVADSTEVSASKAIAKAETTTMNIEGMTCAVGCAKVIENKLAGLEGVQKASVDFDTKTATIEYDATVQTPEKLTEVVEAIADGKTYKVANVKNSADKAMNYGDPKGDPKKEKKSRKERKAEAKAAEANAANCAPKEGETRGGAESSGAKKAGCCAAKKSCSADMKASTL